MTDLQAHLRAHPHDWESWLVFADWLADEGDERAELVRLKYKEGIENLSVAEWNAVQILEETYQRWPSSAPVPAGARL